MESHQYRGYQSVRIQPLRPDLPILPHSVLRSLTHKDDAVTKAKKTIDRSLSTVDGDLG